MEKGPGCTDVEPVMIDMNPLVQNNDFYIYDFFFKVLLILNVLSITRKQYYDIASIDPVFLKLYTVVFSLNCSK